MFVIESDATIVVPLLLGVLLECKAHPQDADALIGQTTFISRRNASSATTSP